jgi:hypothetical protein
LQAEHTFFILMLWEMDSTTTQLKREYYLNRTNESY